MLSNDQIKSLARIYKVLAAALYGNRGPGLAEMQNVQMFPQKFVMLATTKARAEHKMTPRIDKIIAYEYSTYFYNIDSDDLEKNFTTCLPLEKQGVFQVEYMKDHSHDYDGLLPAGVKTMRNVAGLTAQQLADKMGVTLRQVQRWDAGESTPSVKDAQKLAEILGCSISDLF